MRGRTANNHARRVRSRVLYSVPVKRFAFRFPKRDGTSQRISVTALIFDHVPPGTDDIDAALAARDIEEQP